jgi:hypothetical protein
MDKPPIERTTITVKGVAVDAWETARKAANKRGETQGEWLSRACLHLANLESGDAVLRPGKPDTPPPPPIATAADVQATAALLHAMGVAGAALDEAAVKRANQLLKRQMRVNLGLAPPKPRPAPRALPAPAADATQQT